MLQNQYLLNKSPLELEAYNINKDSYDQMKKNYKKIFYFISESKLFDTEYYKTKYPDVKINGIDPLYHYILYGASEGRNPNSWFNTLFYINEYKDVAQAVNNGMNPFYHYIKYGYKEYRRPNSNSFTISSLPLFTPSLSPFPYIYSKKDCEKLYKELTIKKTIIAILATGIGQQTVDIFLFLRKKLIELGYTVIFLLHKSGIERALSLSSPEDRKHIYIFRDIELFKWCPFISILFSSEHAIGYNSKLENFSGKLVLLAHTFSSTYPFGSLSSLSADYIIALPKINRNFPYAWYPNIVKITHNYHLTIIPGYLKMDLLANRCKEEKKQLHKRISFYATLASVAPQRKFETLVTEYVNLIESFFKTYPDWEFVIRPFPGDKGNALLKNLERRFSSNPHFIYDTGPDAYKYLITSDILLIDYSTVFTNYAYGTLRPVIWFRPADTTFASGRFIDKNLGYITNTASQALDSIKDALANQEKWEKTIARVRNSIIPHFGTTCQYISKHINNILQGKPSDDWIMIDKGHTPCSRVADYLKLLKLAVSKKALGPYNKTAVAAWACKQHGPNSKIGLAVIRAYIYHWPEPNHIYLHNYFYAQVQLAFDFTPPSYILALLRHLIKKDPKKNATLVWLAEALSRWAPYGSDFSKILDRLKILSMDTLLASMASRLIYIHRNAPATALDILQRALPDKHINLQDSVYTIYAGLLWELEKYEECKQILDLWQNNRIIENLPLGIFVFRILLRSVNPKRSLSKEFWRTGIFTGPLTKWFFTKNDLAITEELLWEMITQNPKSGWCYIQLSYIYNFYNQLDDAIVYSQKAIEVQPDALWFRNTLAEWLRKKGDLEQVEKIAYDTLNISPSQAWAYIQLANVSNARNKLNDAIVYTQKAIEVRPDAFGFRNTLAEWLRKKGDLEQVEKIAHDTLNSSPNQGWAYIQLANVHNARKELDDAIACARKAIEVQPDALHLRNNLAEFLFKKGNLEEVEQLAYDALSISPVQGWAYIQLANVHDARNELEDAILCAQKAIEVQPGAAHYHTTLEKLLHKQKSAQAKVTQ